MNEQNILNILTLCSAGCYLFKLLKANQKLITTPPKKKKKKANNPKVKAARRMKPLLKCLLCFVTVFSQVALCGRREILFLPIFLTLWRWSPQEDGLFTE